jgi:hypothetical protein
MAISIETKAIDIFDSQPDWRRVKEPIEIRAKTEDKIDSQPDWTRLRQPTEIRARTEDRVDVQPDWTRLRQPIEIEESTEHSPSQPFIDGLTPVTVGSAWREAVLNMAKLKVTTTLPVLDPAPSDTVSAGSTILIPCGDRIPEMGDVFNWIETDPSYVLPDFGLENNKTIILVNDVVTYRDGSQQNGWTVTSTQNNINGFDYELTGPGGILPLGAVTVSVYIEGVEGFQDSYSFTSQETDPPYLDNEDPPHLDTGVAKDKVIEFDLKDDASGVNLALTSFTVEGNPAYNGGTDTFTAPYNGGSSARTPIAGGHHFAVQKTSDWASSANVEYVVTSEDNAGNPLVDNTRSFTVTDYAVPTFVNNTPTGTGVSKSTSVFVSIRDIGGDEINSSSIDATVDTIDAVIDGVFQAGFSGTIVANAFDGFDLTIDKDTDYPSFTDIAVYVYAEDNNANSNNINWSFKTEDYLGPVGELIVPTSGQIDVDLDTLIVTTFSDDDDVDFATIKIEVDKTGTGLSYETAFESGAFQPGWNGPGSTILIDGGGPGIDVITIDPESDLPPNITHLVRLTAFDLTGNPVRFP